MTTQPSADNPCSAPHECIPALRNRYFTGKFMNALDFRIEQDYVVKRRWLHNRLLHGWGIVCGLEVTYHDRPHCRSRWVIVQPGIALDCCGRELVVHEEIRHELPIERATQDGRTPLDAPFLLGIRFRADQEQPVPVLDDGRNCPSDGLEDNYWRECSELAEFPGQNGAFPPGYWLKPNDPAHAAETACRQPPAGEGDGCLCPRCPTGDFVALARIHFANEEGADAHDHGEKLGANDQGGPKGKPAQPAPAGQFLIDLSGRRYVYNVPESLTHISGFNWEHGGQHRHHHPHLCRRHGEHDLHALIVYFDKPLRACEDFATGINKHTFLAHYRSDEGELWRLPYAYSPFYAEKECAAVYLFDFDRIRENLAKEDRAITIFVTLRCDLIIDAQGRAVDGDHLQGRVPTGDDIAGGTFESWFRLILH
jgi:hypothetical protein